MLTKGKIESLPEFIKLEIAALIIDGVSWRNLEKKFNINQSTLRLWAKRHNIKKGDGTNLKRAMVNDLMSTKEIPLSSDYVNIDPRVTAAAKVDVDDMQKGLYAARLGLDLAVEGLSSEINNPVKDAKVAKAWSEVVALNVATIRKIRGLDDYPQQQEVFIEWVGSESNDSKDSET